MREICYPAAIVSMSLSCFHIEKHETIWKKKKKEEILPVVQTDLLK